MLHRNIKLFLLVLSTPSTCSYALQTSSFLKRSSPKINNIQSLTQVEAEKKKKNPAIIIESLMSKLFNNQDSSTLLEELDLALLDQNIPSWTELRQELESKFETEEERTFRSNLVKGYGKAGSPLNKIRLFTPDENNKEEDIRVIFYRDSASWCPYCQKVWMTLEEKQIPYKVEKVNMRCYGEKPMEFMRLQPSGNIPVAVIDGKVYGQSNDIIFALENLFPDKKKLLPVDTRGREKIQELLRLERQIFSAWMYWLTSSWGAESNKTEFLKILDNVEKELSNSPGGDFFMGREVTVVDFMFAPFLERMASSLLYFKGFQMRYADNIDIVPYPALNRWFDAMETLDSYRLTKSDHYTHCWDLPPQLGGCASDDSPEAKSIEKAINGERSIGGRRQGSWELPLQPHNGGIEPDWKWCNDEGLSKREAVERLTFNSENIIKFASRGAGKQGFPPYSAPLADPNATPSDAVQVSVDCVLRIISKALLNNVASEEPQLETIVHLIKTKGGESHTQMVINSLSYLRDRVGVPRDMRLPAARQFRAHLNWAIERLL